MKFVELPEKIEKNLVVIAPTGSGKTTAVLKNLDSYKLQFKRIFLTFPTKALMSEIAKKLPESSFLLDNSDARLREHIDISNWINSKVVISSYEKLDSMTLMFPELFRDSLVVIDEIHLATDDDRAISILSILASAKENGAKIIAMSATIPNVKELAEYLDAEIIGVENTTDRELKIIDMGCPPRGTEKYIRFLTYHITITLKNDKEIKQTIIFRPARKQCELIAELLRKNGIQAKAYHAGISINQRKEIIEQFNSGKLPVIVSTHALCWGVNTPAERVIIAGALIYKPFGPEIILKSVDVLQMAGRAGRPGYSEKAEVVVITTSETLIKCGNDYMTEKEFFEKSLKMDYMEEIGLKTNPATIILRLIRARKIKTVDDVFKISESWFNVPGKEEFRKAIETLKNFKNPLIEIENNEIKLTEVGSIVAEYYVDVRTYKEIENIIINDLDLEYLRDRMNKLIVVAKVARRLRPSALTIPDEAMSNSLVLSITDDEAREVIAQFVKITGDTDPLAESMKNIAFFVNRIAYVFNCGSDDWWILGKTMKQIRSMIYNNVPIKDILNSYIDGSIDKFFDVVSLWKP